MATAHCSECSQVFDTSRHTYPWCSYACKREDARRKERPSPGGGSSSHPSRPGTLRGY
jgi:hypothetical protein